MNILDNKVLFITDKLIAYPKKGKMTHQACMEDFANNFNYPSARSQYFAKINIAVLQILKIKKDNYQVYGYIPENITNEQLDILNAISQDFDKVTRFEIIKLKNNTSEYYESNNNCKEEFIEGFINQYYKDNNKIK